MIRLQAAIVAFLIASVFAAEGIAADAASETAAKKFDEFQKALAYVKATQKSLGEEPGGPSLADYKAFADGIVRDWSNRNKEHFGWLIYEVSPPLNGCIFRGNVRGYELGWKYALLALDKPDAIPLDLELHLTGQVTSMLAVRNVPRGEDFAQLRRKDAEVVLHAWRRLLNAVDPNWNPDELTGTSKDVAFDLGLPNEMGPEYVQEPLRSKYVAALAVQKQKADQYWQQHIAHGWLKSRFPEIAEERIVDLYSQRPYDTGELKQYLTRFLLDEATRTRIANVVTKKCEAQEMNAR